MMPGASSHSYVPFLGCPPLDLDTAASSALAIRTCFMPFPSEPGPELFTSDATLKQGAFCATGPLGRRVGAMALALRADDCTFSVYKDEAEHGRPRQILVHNLTSERVNLPCGEALLCCTQCGVWLVLPPRAVRVHFSVFATWRFD